MVAVSHASAPAASSSTKAKACCTVSKPMCEDCESRVFLWYVESSLDSRNPPPRHAHQWSSRYRDRDFRKRRQKGISKDQGQTAHVAQPAPQDCRLDCRSCAVLLKTKRRLALNSESFSPNALPNAQAHSRANLAVRFLYTRVLLLAFADHHQQLHTSHFGVACTQDQATTLGLKKACTAKQSLTQNGSVASN